MPVNYVGVYSAMRFTNWLNNGQGNADTETGAYTLSGSFSTITRSPNAHIVLPTENEWYKAAYYNPATATYLAYPGSNTPPTPGPPPGGPKSANWKSPEGAISGGDLTPVGAYSTTMSSFGTFDQFGDVAQLLEPGSGEWVRGFSFLQGPAIAGFAYADFPIASIWQALSEGPGSTVPDLGFRVAMVPEPSSVLLAALGLIGLAVWGYARGEKAAWRSRLGSREA